MTTDIPKPDTPLVDARGLLATPWYKYFVSLQKAATDTGGADDAFILSGVLGAQGGQDAEEVFALLALPTEGPEPYQRGIRLSSASTQIGPNDFTVLLDATSGPVTAALPPASANRDRIVVVKKIDITANTVSIAANGSDLIDWAPAQIIATQWQAMAMQSNGAKWFLI